MSKIEWTEKTWNPTLGCTEVSPGCEKCYAARMAHRLSFNPVLNGDYDGLTKKLPNGKMVWTGLVREMPGRLTEPLKIKKPTVWFVDSMSDLFHKDVSFQFIVEVFHIMNKCPRHTFQILTKRPDRMLEFMCDWAPNPYGSPYEPLPNVWLGVSVENQKAAEERIPLLTQVPAAIRFLSCEPLLGHVDISKWFYPSGFIGTDVSGFEPTNKPLLEQPIHWVICGGESGPKARSMHPDWAISLRNQCITAGVPFFFKQWGGVNKKAAGRLLEGKYYDEYPKKNN